LVRAFDAGARPARPGEFTLRAFLSGRVDLMQAEAVLGVIDAHDHKQLERALRQLAGNLSLPLARVRSDLLNLLADLEAGLDFVDEDISFVSNEDCRARIRAAREVPARLLQQSGSRMQSSGRKRIVLAGLPNAGKSTLFNALLNRAAAIVSDVSGTTRDTLRGLVDWQGLSVELVDTPGRDAEAAAINQEAQQLAVEQIEGADLILWCRSSQLEGTDVALDAQLQEELARSGCKTIAAVTKCDLADGGSIEQGHRISALTGVGLDALRQTVFERMCDPGDGNDELVGTTAARCHDSLSRTIAALDRALQAAEDRQGDELIALELRDALEPIGQILGAVYTDDILDRIFSRFCIGK
ncbi:MAG: tRNA modification GTPase, partial [Planctomycetaceae bacterium]